MPDEFRHPVNPLSRYKRGLFYWIPAFAGMTGRRSVVPDERRHPVNPLAHCKRGLFYWIPAFAGMTGRRSVVPDERRHRASHRPTASGASSTGFPQSRE